MTPHISAKKGEIANIVLMPGDPLRAKWIAENFLKDCKLVNEIRGMLCYTGTYKGKQISVMGHGMGIPSIGIYSYELYKFYDVDLIIRVGSTGSYKENINLGDLIVVNEAYSESTYAKMIGVSSEDVLKCPSPEINEIILNTSFEINKKVIVGRTHSSDVFYKETPFYEISQITGACCVEMESFGLFANAKLLNKKASTILTCSDSLVTGESMDPLKRQTTFKDMIELTLESVLKMDL